MEIDQSGLAKVGHANDAFVVTDEKQKMTVLQLLHTHDVDLAWLKDCVEQGYYSLQKIKQKKSNIG